MLGSVRLGMNFDVARLREDLARIPEDAWVPHFNTQYYEGEWSGVPLRTTAGAHVALYPDPTSKDYVDLPVLEECRYFAEVMAAFACPLQVVRLLRLKAGSSIREHRDYGQSLEDGEVRIHVPIQTDPAVEFYSDGRRVDMQPGEAWYLNVNLPHSVRNRSEHDRIHMVIDCVVNDWVREICERATPFLPSGAR